MDCSAEGPDRGWSWVIAFVAFFNNFIFHGIIRSSGIIFVAVIREYGVSREEASWPVVLCSIFVGFAGAVSGSLAQRFGIRPLVFFGSIVGAAGLSACFLTTSLASLAVIYGVVFGIGMGFVAPMMSIAINQYFLKYRVTASGLAHSGACFGTMLFPSLFDFFIEKYSLAGCFLLTGGITLHSSITAFLLRPAPPLKKPLPAISESDHSVKINEAGSLRPTSCERAGPSVLDAAGFHLPGDYEAAGSGLPDSHEAARIREGSLDSLKVNPTELISPNQCTFKCSPVEENVLSKKKDQDMEESGSNSERIDHYNLSEQFRKSIVGLEESYQKFEEVYADSIKWSPNNKFLLNERYPNGQNYSLPTESQETIYKSPETDISVKEEDRICNSNLIDKSKTFFSAASDHANCLESRDLKSEINLRKRPRESERSILKSIKTVGSCPMIYVTIFTALVFYTLYHVFFVIIVDYALDLKIPRHDTKYTLVGFAVTDLVGRLGFGWVTDHKFLTRQQFVMVCMALQGLLWLLFPLASNLTILVTVCCLCGLISGSTMVMFTVLMVDYVEIQLIPVAIGYLCFFSGLAGFVRPFLIGFFRDTLGSYSNIFYALGATSIATSLLWTLERCFVKKLTSKTVDSNKQQPV